MKKAYPVFFFLLISISLFSQPGNWLKGYVSDIKGEVLTYHAPHPEVTTSLLIRNQDSTKYIAWRMGKVPENTDAREFTFVWIFGIDVNENSYPYRMYLDGEYLLSFKNPTDTLTKKWSIEGKGGSRIDFQASLVDKYGDLMGYAFLTVPSKMLREGTSPEIEITATSSGDPCWYMTHRYAMNACLLVKQMPALMNTAKGESYVLRFDIHHFGENTTAQIMVGNKEMDIPVKMGMNYTYFPVSGNAGDVLNEISVNVGGVIKKLPPVTLKAVSPVSLYLLHHSHSDIGYTHHQSEVEKMHHSFFREAVELWDKTESYPEGSRFKWNVEVCWAVESYLETCSPDEKANFIRVVEQGGIGLDGLWTNQLTGICSPEELIQLIQRSARVADECNISLRSAMITDIPGYTWSLVPVMAKSGIRYFSPGTNVFHRIGDIKDVWGDKPFYWVSKNGQDSVLTWFPARGYSWFHTGLGSGEPKNLLTEEPIFEYLDELERTSFPYDMSIIRYNIGSDNGPPHRSLPDIVKAWNERYVTPKLYIATTTEAFEIFENKHGSELPSFSGDLSPYWEDGAYSSARETILVNESAERLVQAQTLWVLSGNKHYPFVKINELWKYILLFNEHTWGSWNSISAPHDPFTLAQWETKQSFAFAADSLSRDFLKNAMRTVSMEQDNDKLAFDIWNTHSWEVTDVITVPLPPGIGNVYVTDEQNRRLKTQYMSDGSLAVLVQDVAPFSARRISIHKEQNRPLPLPPGESGINVVINEKTGSIGQLSFAGQDLNLVDTASGYGLNEYIYVEGRDPSNRQYANSVEVSRLETGSLINTFRIHSSAPGTKGLVQEICLLNELNRVDIINTLDKSAIYEPEGVHFAFPFNIPGGDVRVNLAWDWYLAGQEQLPGSNFNYSSMSRWVDISNSEQGICMVSPDAALLEMEDISMDVLSYGEKDGQGPSQTIFSYVMNNYWETNYRAAQPGKTSFSYSLFPHAGFDPVFNMKRALERTQPLLVIPASGSKKTSHPLLILDNEDVLITALIPGEDKKHFLIRLYNPTDMDQEVRITWNLVSSLAVDFSISDLSGEGSDPITWPLVLKAHDFQTLKVEF